MKLRKTRIKKEMLANGKVEYWPEYKYWFWWTSFGDLYADSDVFKVVQEWFQHKLDNSEEIVRNKQQCKDLIDFYIDRVKHKQASKLENAVVKSEYERYP